ncbi:hypothetical protein [Sporosarcina sp. Marseille-Q4943]|uniref:hypothetical protein n=1 Tax=Sporosarcina sp. Marseille-Q4943 TaxID=2942204 RepID=UPI00208DB9D6|nr:hypothetical protein [Sporosarcina sp. Marseille-Q4943]
MLFDEVEVKWKWTESELIKFRKMWKDGASIQQIGKELKINKRSIGLLVIDQAEQGEIKPRPGGCLGNKKKQDLSLLLLKVMMKSYIHWDKPNIDTE